ncbi:hypothetical protein EVAR_29329_1 [Eumeta japonica]|uniref:Uncharacterized protein n=1 Tax=Eumeta variegata TaxID=151549 RepID=A0A4C1WI74_EUMVA|nr:hypothetical protein EVAR_29329_1 [Eumeta japonica]
MEVVEKHFVYLPTYRQPCAVVRTYTSVVIIGIVMSVTQAAFTAAAGPIVIRCITCSYQLRDVTAAVHRGAAGRAGAGRAAGATERKPTVLPN